MSQNITKPHTTTLSAQPGAVLLLAASAANIAARLPRLALAAEELADRLVMGPHGQKKAGSGGAFWQFRNFASGDPASDIDWRQSARSETKLFVRETELDSAVAIRVWVDLSRGMQYSSRSGLASKAECAIILSTALILTALQADETVQILSDGDGLPSNQPSNHLGGRLDAAYIIERLIEAGAASQGQHDRPRRLPALPEPATQGRCVMISDFFEPIGGIEAALNEMSACGLRGYLVQILDPAEQQFPFRGRIRFHAPARTASRLFGDAADVADAYHAAMTAHNEALQAKCHDIGWYYSRHVTENPIFDTIMPLIDYLNTHKSVSR